MAEEMVLTVLARDRPGLIKSLSETIAAHGGNWIDSSMARLGGEFAGILRVSVPAGKAGALEASLSGLRGAGIDVTVRHGETVPRSSDGRRVRLELMGVDHPGIIHGISAALSAVHINIEELETRVFPGSMSGEPMFQANAEIVLSSGVDETSLRTTLESLARDLMVDIEIEPA